PDLDRRARRATRPLADGDVEDLRARVLRVPTPAAPLRGPVHRRSAREVVHAERTRGHASELVLTRFEVLDLPPRFGRRELALRGEVPALAVGPATRQG